MILTNTFFKEENLKSIGKDCNRINDMRLIHVD